MQTFTSTSRFPGQSYTVPATSVAGATFAPTTFGTTSYAAPAVSARFPGQSYTVPATSVAGFAPTSYAPTTYAPQSIAQPTYVSAQSTMPYGSISTVVGQPQMFSSAQSQMFSTAQSQMFSSAQPPVIFSAGPVAATYIGGMAVNQASANLLAAGRVISERVMSLEECYSSGIVRADGGVVVAPQFVAEIIETVQVVNELVVDQAGQLEILQVPEIVETVVVQQPVEVVQTIMVEQPVMVACDFEQPVMDPPFQELVTGEVREVVMEEQMMVEQGFVEQLVEGEVQQPGPPRVVIICTSASSLGDQPTGAWSEEITAPYYVFVESGCEVYIASINGGQVPIDAGSLAENFFTESDRNFQESGGMNLLENSIAIADVSPEAIDCVWLAGGHGTCMDFEGALAQFVTDAVAMGRPVGAVCHGVCGLLSAVDQDGAPLLAGKQVTGFSNAEEDAVGLSGVVPFLCQDRMQELGALYSCDAPWSEYAIRDGNIITGQNPQSSMKAAQLCVQAMMPPDMQQEEGAPAQ